MEFSDYWEIVVSNIRRELECKNWSIQELADNANKDRSAMSKIVSGPQRDMKLSTLLSIAEALEIDVCQLLPKVK